MLAAGLAGYFYLSNNPDLALRVAGDRASAEAAGDDYRELIVITYSGSPIPLSAKLKAQIAELHGWSDGVVSDLTYN